MKYIDAEKLKARIREWYNNYKIGQHSPFRNGKVEALREVSELINSLQQEQPDCHTVEDWMQHIKNADQLTKDTFSKGPYNVLYDALNHPYQHCYDAIKEFGELCFQTGVHSVKQEQPEVDLEKALNGLDNAYFDLDGIAVKGATYYLTVNDLKDIARDFYELGFNARKEE